MGPARAPLLLLSHSLPYDSPTAVSQRPRSQADPCALESAHRPAFQSALPGLLLNPLFMSCL